MLLPERSTGLVIHSSELGAAVDCAMMVSLPCEVWTTAAILTAREFSVNLG